MAWQLVTEVLHHAPPSVKANHRALLVAIADEVHQSRIPTRSAALARGDLAARAGLSEDAARKALASLARLGHEVRGPEHAHTGRVTTYRVPAFPAPADCRCTVCGQGRRNDRALTDDATADKAGETTGLSEGEGMRIAHERACESHPPTGSTPGSDSSGKGKNTPAPSSVGGRAPSSRKRSDADADAATTVPCYFCGDRTTGLWCRKSADDLIGGQCPTLVASQTPIEPVEDPLSLRSVPRRATG